MKIFATSDIYGNKALIYLVREITKKENADDFRRIFDKHLANLNSCFLALRR